MPHWLALGAQCFLALTFAVLVINGNDGLALLPVVAALVPAAGVLLSQRSPTRSVLVLWCIETAAVIALTVLVTSAAVDERRLMVRREPCTLQALAFENDSVATLQVEWWPPRVLCRYGYSQLHAVDEVWESRWWVYWPAGFLPLAGLMTIGAARTAMRLRREVYPAET